MNARTTQQRLMSNWRWWICSLLFVATTVNYLDRQVLSLTYKEFIAPQFHWTDADYGTITSVFSILYAAACLFAGRFVDWMGTKKGYLIAIGVWSAGAMLHAGCGWATAQLTGIGSVAAMRAVESGSTAALAISTTSVWLFLLCRGILAVGESGNFPAAIKTTAEYFPKKDRAFATSIFNAGASVGALAAPLCIPPLAKHLGWEWAFIIIGALGFLWMAFWVLMYEKPEKSLRVNEEELAYIRQDEAAGESGTATRPATAGTAGAAASETTSIPLLRCFRYRQTWSFILGKFLTDGVWWFFLFWAPAYFHDQFGAAASSGLGQGLIFTLYAIVTVVSIFGGYLPKMLVEKKGMHPYNGRMQAMLIFAFFPLFALLAQPLGMQFDNPWWPALLIGIAGAAHQSWSANIFSTVSDMFPRSTVASITGIGTMAGGIGSMLIQKIAGSLFTYAEQAGSAFRFLGFEGKPAGYFIIFCYCGVAYLLAWALMKTLVPRYAPIQPVDNKTI